MGVGLLLALDTPIPCAHPPVHQEPRYPRVPSHEHRPRVCHVLCLLPLLPRSRRRDPPPEPPPPPPQPNPKPAPLEQPQRHRQKYKRVRHDTALHGQPAEQQHGETEPTRNALTPSPPETPQQVRDREQLREPGRRAHGCLQLYGASKNVHRVAVQQMALAYEAPACEVSAQEAPPYEAPAENCRQSRRGARHHERAEQQPRPQAR